MRIVIDLQAAQAENRYRGIGRYSLSLTRAMIEEGAGHEIILMLNGLFPETLEPLREHFSDILPTENIVVWYTPGPVSSSTPSNFLRVEIAQRMREACIENLQADIVLIASFFDGFGDGATTQINAKKGSTPVCTILYDLIPLLNAKDYLDHNPAFKEFYLNKISQISQAALILSISESARQEALNNLPVSEQQVVNISSAIDGFFHPIEISQSRVEEIKNRYGISKPFLMYTGGIDPRKNLEGLIKAYALLPHNLRNQYQLIIVCSLQIKEHSKLLRLANELDLLPGDLLLTGYISDEELLSLYNLCYLFVFPSWHEGFGLPVLEAMACGCAVIASNTSSLPEVLGSDVALFDPYSVQAIAQKIVQILENENLRKSLKSLNVERAKLFSWKRTAIKALRALDEWHLHYKKEVEQKLVPTNFEGSKPLLAFISPLPDERSGISDYSAELLPELARYYTIEVIVAQRVIADPWINQHCHIRSIEWFLANANQYERVLYHFGNSTFHDHMFELLKKVPGIVVLHDFYLSGILAHREVHGNKQYSWVEGLYFSHGFHAVHDRFHAKDTADVVWKYPCNLPIVQDALGMIVHSEHSRSLFAKWYGLQAARDCFVIPLLRTPLLELPRDQVRARLNIKPEDFVVCSFGVLGTNKLNHRLLSAWLNSRLANDRHCILVFVGSFASPAYEQEIWSLIDRSVAPERIRITGWTDAKAFKEYLACADAAVQLRSLSRGETSAAVLDCFNAALPTLINRHGSMVDLPADLIYELPDQFTDQELVDALEQIWRNPSERAQIARRAKAYLSEHHAPQACALQYVKTIEKIYAKSRLGPSTLVERLADVMPASSSDHEIEQVAQAITTTIPPKYRTKQILVDISELVLRDSRSGIQRVVRSILREWLLNPPNDYRIEPVYASTEHGYCYARSFTLQFLSCPHNVLFDEPIEYYPGDRFIGLDLQPHVVIAQASTYQRMRKSGVLVQFVIYDLLPVLMPQFFVKGAKDLYQSWLTVVAKSHHVWCISAAVAEQFRLWQSQQSDPLLKRAQVGWFHLGADLASSVPTIGLPQEGAATHLHQLMRLNTVFLMVGTLEARKGHTQVLKAFEELWAQGCVALLVIVGKRGWLVEELIEKLESHPQRNVRLFWLETVSDEYLEMLYDNSDCLIAASEGEGFGLPLIEAAQHQLAIIARDLPVFREVAGDHAYYFSGSSPTLLANSINYWIELYQAGCHPQSIALPWKTWQQSAQDLSQRVMGV